MFKKTTSKESKIKDIVKFLKLLPESQIDQVTEALLYGRISAVANTRLVEDFTRNTIVSNDKAPLETVTKKVNAKTANTKRMSKAQVSKKYGNKIGFEVNTKNSFYHAKSGDIDGKFAKWADLTEWLVVSDNPRKSGEIRVFFNFIEEELKTDFIKVAKKEGFEVSFN